MEIFVGVFFTKVVSSEDVQFVFEAKHAQRVSRFRWRTVNNGNIYPFSRVRVKAGKHVIRVFPIKSTEDIEIILDHCTAMICANTGDLAFRSKYGKGLFFDIILLDIIFIISFLSTKQINRVRNNICAMTFSSIMHIVNVTPLHII